MWTKKYFGPWDLSKLNTGSATGTECSIDVATGNSRLKRLRRINGEVETYYRCVGILSAAHTMCSLVWIAHPCCSDQMLRSDVRIEVVRGRHSVKECAAYSLRPYTALCTCTIVAWYVRINPVKHRTSPTPLFIVHVRYDRTVLDFSESVNRDIRHEGGGVRRSKEE